MPSHQFLAAGDPAVSGGPDLAVLLFFGVGILLLCGRSAARLWLSGHSAPQSPPPCRLPVPTTCRSVTKPPKNAFGSSLLVIALMPALLLAVFLVLLVPLIALCFQTGVNAIKSLARQLAGKRRGAPLSARRE